MINVSIFLPKLILFLITAIVININFYLASSLISLSKKAEKKDTISFILLLAILVGSTIGHCSWFIKLLRLLIFPQIPYSLVVFFARTAHAFLAIQYQSLLLLVSRLLKVPHLKSFWGKLLISISGSFSFYFLYAAFFEKGLLNEVERYYALEAPNIINAPLEIRMMKYIALYLLPLTSVFCLWILLKGMRKPDLPKIVKQQMNTLIQFLICPLLLIEVLIFSHGNVHKASLYTVSIVGISTLLTTAAIYYCLRILVPLRFLNLKPHVESPNKFYFVNEFADIIEQMDQATTTEELVQITQQFFKTSLLVPLDKTSVHILNHGTYKGKREEFPMPYLHKVSSNTNSLLSKYIKKHKVVIYDDLMFNQYHEVNQEEEAVIEFMDTLNADIFLPIYRKDIIIAAVIIQRNALPNQTYNKIHRNELIIFSTYVGNTLHNIQASNIEQCMIVRRNLENELHDKHRLMEQYRESIHSMVRLEQPEVGIIIYKNRRFTFVNEAAKEMVSLNLNTQVGHPLAKTIKNITQKVENYHASKQILFKDSKNRSISINATPSIEHNSIIITLSRPDATELIKKQIGQLKNPSDQDFLLYLETTKSGRLVNQAIPVSTPTFLNFKINLLKVAISKKAILLDMPQDDLFSTVKLIHDISLHEKLHILELHEPSTDNTIAFKLFGANEVLDSSKSQDGLLKTIGIAGTLYIKNVHHLTRETQSKLAEYLNSGQFKPMHSSQKITSNVRLIFSSNENLQQLMLEHKFSPELYALLQRSSLTMPSLHNLPAEELEEITSDLTREALSDQEFKELYHLTEADKQGIINTAPISISQLQKRITKILFTKAKSGYIENIEFDPEYITTRPQIAEACKLGRYALKDKSTMSLLWDTFKNQNKIATLLGVNRSSVSRRCKEYGLA